MDNPRRSRRCPRTDKEANEVSEKATWGVDARLALDDQAMLGWLVKQQQPQQQQQQQQQHPFRKSVDVNCASEV